MTYKAGVSLKQQGLNRRLALIAGSRKAGILDFMPWLGIGLLVMAFIFGPKPKSGILQYAHLNDKGLYVKDFNGQERKAYMVGDNIYVDGQLVGRRISSDQIPGE